MKKRDENPARQSDRPREPQSYGSEKDWLTGNTGQTPSPTQPASPMPDDAFYESRQEVDQSPGDKGGSVGEFQLQDGTDPMPLNARAEDVEASTSWKVTEAASGRQSFWRKRDYE